MSLFILIKENLKSKKITFIGLLILMMIISFILITVISVNANIDKSINEAHEFIDNGDINAWIQPNEELDSLINKIENLDYTTKTKTFDTIEVLMEITDQKYTNGTQCRRYSDQEYRLYNDSIDGFISPEQLNKGEIYLPVTFSTSYNLSINDFVYINVEGTQYAYKIKGFVEEPISGSSMMGIKSAFISDEDFDFLNSLYNPECENNNCVYKYKMISIYQNGSIENDELIHNVNKDTGIMDNSSFSITKEESKYYHSLFNKIVSGFLYGFAAILTFVVIIVISYSINNSIEADFKSIGILKSIGISNNKIRLSLILEYLIVCLLGAIIGGSLSLIGIKYLSTLMVSITGILPLFNINISSIYLLLILIIGILLFIILKTSNVAKISPLKAITNDAIKINKNKIRNRITARLLNLKLALRQIFSGISKYISIAIISAVLVFLMVLITSLNDEIQSGRVLDSIGLAPYDLSVSKGDNDYTKVDEIINKYTNINNKYHMSGWYFTIDDYQYYGQVSSDFSALDSITEGRKPENKEEIIISKIIADKIEKYIGDTVEVSLDDATVYVKIVGYYQTTNDVGKCFMLREDTMRLLYPELEWHSFQYKLDDTTDHKEFTKELEETFDDIDVYDVADDSSFIMIRQLFNALNIIAYVIAIIFIVISVILISHRMLLYEEKTFGIYKAVGFNTTKLRIQFAFRFLFISFIGSIIGAIVCTIFNDQLIILLLKGMGVTNYTSEISLIGLLLPILFVNACFFIFTYLISLKIKHVSTKELITE